MASEFDSSVLAIVRADAGKLLGTGFVISPNLVLTCAHLFDEREISKQGEMQLPAHIIALFGDSVLRSSRIYNSQPLDLCCLHFAAIPGAVPIPLVRSARLQEVAITAVGFTPDENKPRRHIAHDLKVVHELHSDGKGWIQFCQLQGGAPEGFSGGPVLAKTDCGWEAVGMLQLGRESAPTSRFIGVDPIVSCLTEYGLEVTAGELVANVGAAKAHVTSAPSQTVNFGSVNSSNVIVKLNQNSENPR